MILTEEEMQCVECIVENKDKLYSEFYIAGGYPKKGYELLSQCIAQARLVPKLVEVLELISANYEHPGLCGEQALINKVYEVIKLVGEA